MEDRRSIAKKAAIGVALVIAAAGAVLFYKNNIAMNPGDTLLKYMSYQSLLELPCQSQRLGLLGSGTVVGRKVPS